MLCYIFKMFRLMFTTTICLLISFGAISKNQQASKIINHVSQEHHKHQHSIGHKHVAHHDHHTDDSDNTSQPEEETTPPNHSHTLELSLLAFPMSVNSSQNFSTVLPMLIEQKIESSLIDLNICHFTSTVFRPPIA